ncbi:hypothetical protein Acy02nite_82310 [Actinoplanes cyaneus]|uniref:Uncharacterized protein n=1 Tax=Actinoplanes cyaneus TaxID=52696 RepID=A0A919IQH7_9ACTN|nr:hypothetical protein [Actinoplanes cyaneus]MCW2143495.1 hypothetical protein [Actinoplanes cyaneus]GID70350.1 hypothetical protein Acy02nite_82310 [Actinoplanes cyaneus]
MGTHLARSLVTAGLAVAATLAPTGSAGAAVPAWHLPPPVPLPPGATNTVLQDVAMAAPDDVWAVGTWWNSQAEGPFTVHWNGQAWTLVPPPELSQPTYLTGVDALASDDVWAVGSGDDDAPGAPRPTTAVIMHFDGTAWTSVPVPAAPAGVESNLDDIDGSWAVGHTEADGVSRPLVLHRTGGVWAVSPTPDLPGVELTSVGTTAGGDVWAVGSPATVLHFDGTAWTRVDVPVTGKSVLNSVAAAAGDVWAAGADCVTPLVCVPLVLHRTATGWRTESSADGSAVTEIVASKSGVWTFGYRSTVTGLKSGHVERWTGQAFRADASIAPPGGPSGPVRPQGEIASATPLAGATSDPAGTVLWAVGWQAGPPRSPNVLYRS